MLIYAHRGGRGYAPEHTLPGFEMSLSKGADFLDADIQMSKDGIIVLYHDSFLNPDFTKDINGNFVSKDKRIFIKDLNFEQLQDYEIGHIDINSGYAKKFPDQMYFENQKILSLDFFLEWVKSYKNKNKNKFIGLQFEIKYNQNKQSEYNFPDKIVMNLLKTLEKYDFRDDLLDLEIQAFHWDCLKLVNDINPNIRTSYLMDKENSKIFQIEESLKIIAHNNGYIWGPEESMVTKELVKRAKNYDLDVIPWFSSTFNSTCDISAEMYQKSRLKELDSYGVKGVILDWVGF